MESINVPFFKFRILKKKYEYTCIVLVIIYLLIVDFLLLLLFMPFSRKIWKREKSEVKLPENFQINMYFSAIKTYVATAIVLQ